jgi:hypothetical protein
LQDSEALVKFLLTGGMPFASLNAVWHVRQGEARGRHREFEAVAQQGRTESIELAASIPPSQEAYDLLQDQCVLIL